jgi:hypothetical protein
MTNKPKFEVVQTGEDASDPESFCVRSVVPEPAVKSAKAAKAKAKVRAPAKAK